MGMTDFPNISEPVKPLYETSTIKTEELNRRSKQSNKKSIEKRNSATRKSTKRKLSLNSVLPFDGVIVPKIQHSSKQEILIRSGYKWCSYLHRPKMDDGFEEVHFQDDTNLNKSNFHTNLEVNMKSGDSSNTVATYLEHNQKNHDYIDDVLSFQPQLNNYQSIKEPSNISEPNADTTNRNYRNKYISIGVQASPLPPYRLRVLPKCPQAPVAKKLDDASIGDNEVVTPSGCLLCVGIQSCGHCVGRVFMSQCGLGIALFAWALLGAAAFHFTEGPSELQEAQRLKTLQNDLVVGLATDLRLIDNLQPAWRETIEKYIDKHEVLLLEGVSSGYGEGGGKNGQIWSYPGCILFAISLLTTLGFGAPVPRTTMGRTTAVVFSAIGIPFHFLLILNVGMVLARILQRWSASYPPYTLDTLNEKKCHSFDFNIVIPKWLTWFPVVAGITYYILGTLIFGVARSRKFESFLFPLDFTATGGVGLTPGYMRIGYGIYLEGGVILAGIAVSLLQNSATSKLTEIGLKLGLLTNS